MVNVPPASVFAAIKRFLSSGSVPDTSSLRRAARDRQSPGDPGSSRDRQATVVATVPAADLHGANMINFQLSGVDLSGADLSGAQFIGQPTTARP
jgi:uncharacterized protein YjbI with pentapeptide repeats